jgi:hypothetical protein
MQLRINLNLYEFSSLKKVGRLTKFHVFKLQKSLTLISSRNKRLNLGWAYPTPFLSQIIHPIDNGFALTNLCVPDVHQLIYLFAKILVSIFLQSNKLK